MKHPSLLYRIFPAAQWLSRYTREQFSADLSASLIVSLLLIPQSLAYAMLAGAPPVVGLYASILPLLAYAIWGSSRTMSVGPVAVLSLMTAASLANLPAALNASYLEAAIALAGLSGVFLLLLGVFRLGFFANFLSHTVISGFITASAIIIVLSQLKHIFGVPASGDTLPKLLHAMASHIGNLSLPTTLVGVACIGFLVFAKRYLTAWLTGLGLSKKVASVITKMAPNISAVTAICVVAFWHLDQAGVAITGTIPQGLPSFHLQLPSMDLLRYLTPSALMLAIIGYVESVAIAKTLAAKRREKIQLNQELIGLGMANCASALSGAIPVTGGFSRSVVNFDAGAKTQLAAVFTAVGITLASLFLTPILYFLPKAVLAATIIVAVVNLMDFHIFRKTWDYSKSDFAALSATLMITLLAGVEIGVACGVTVSIGLHLYRTSRPHIAETGRLADTEHFRNIRRYDVETRPEILSLRMDESLIFANASWLEARIQDAVYQRDKIAHVILQCSGMNEIDFSALEMLEDVNKQLANQGIQLHLSEVKGPVMDALQGTHFLQELSGKVFTSHYQAFCYTCNLYDGNTNNMNT